MTDSTPDQNKRHAEKMAKVQTARAKMMAEKTVTKGLIIVHTGTGKGKSSSAFGMIMHGCLRTVNCLRTALATSVRSM